MGKESMCKDGKLMQEREWKPSKKQKGEDIKKK